MVVGRQHARLATGAVGPPTCHPLVCKETIYKIYIEASSTGSTLSDCWHEVLNNMLPVAAIEALDDALASDSLLFTDTFSCCVCQHAHILLQASITSSVRNQ